MRNMQLNIPVPFQQALQQGIRVNSSLLVNARGSARFWRSRSMLNGISSLRKNLC